MIQKPTVLILGAGASKPYGYPLGKELVERVLRLTAQRETSVATDGALRSALLNGFSPNHVNEFRKSLQAGKPASIDDFLEANREFSELGRVCIAAALTVFGPPEDEVTELESDWLEYVWWRLHDDAPTSAKFANNRLSIITYNYDTSFERYLAGVLRGFYPDLRRGEPDAIAFTNEHLPIVHIHGSLGRFIDEVRSLENPLDRNQITWYKDAASAIRILNEGEHAVEYSRAREWMRDADVIYLLGFGYHRTNTSRLGLREQITATAPAHPDRVVKGTALGLGQAKRDDVERSLNLDDAMTLRSDGVLFSQDARAFLEAHGLA